MNKNRSRAAAVTTLLLTNMHSGDRNGQALIAAVLAINSACLDPDPKVRPESFNYDGAQLRKMKMYQNLSAFRIRLSLYLGRIIYNK